ncbi:ATP-grasp domain-containing protein [Brevibacillus ginsengisoli]|uniref:ATP-grasp domain-containing protein n=1 Tax=Brevibacillus ginsengisoli TaxID=363854 RepID=UPI003CEB12C2
MFILDKPYVSPFLASTLVDTQMPVMIMGDVAVPERHRLNLLTQQDFIQNLMRQNHYPVLTNSENAFSQLEKHLPDSSLVRNISLFKNKVTFRRWLSQIYPSFFFREVSITELATINPATLPYPIIIKPAVGYASLGVYRVVNQDEWYAVSKLIKAEVQLSNKLYSNTVYDSSTFIIEEWIQGSEYAIDAYYNESGEPVVLNVFKRMFFHDGDTSDRIYYTSKEVLNEALASVQSFLHTIGQKAKLNNFPLHVEIRMKENGELVPIEVNPLRFSGIGTNELGFYAYGVNTYESFIKQTKPDWDSILASMDDSLYSFFCAGIPNSIDPDIISSVDEEGLRRQFAHVLHSYSLFPKDPATFAVLFYKSESSEENKRLLTLDLSQFLRCLEPVTT